MSINKLVDTLSIFPAIIGAGLSGASTAYFLQSMKPPNDKNKDDLFQIDIFEKSAQAGGRLALTTVQGKPYEFGASAMHPDHFYMQNFTQILGESNLMENIGQKTSFAK